MADAFSGRTAVITGGASGIGRAVGEQLVRRGAEVWLGDLDGVAAEKAAAAMEGPGSAHGVTVDVREAQAVDAVVSEVVDARGRLDFMFNNAGIALFGDLRNMSLEQWGDLIDVNLRGVVHGVASAYPRMIEQGHGHIVNTASAAGLLPIPYNTAYSATKHAVVGLSSGLRMEAERYGVRVSAVCPGVVDTPIVDRMILLGVDREELLANATKLYPVERCARKILRGVERNRGIIVVTKSAHVLWRLYRFTPRLAGWMLRALARRSPFAK
jgi:NAD(P)-dependent dehydrogenase (short-subunit alcohol dehydrogenase family)